MKKKNGTRIFISYRSDGGYEYAKALDLQLIRYKEKYDYDVKVFWDKEGLRHYTGHYPEPLKNALDTCNVFLLLLSKDCFQIKPDGETDWYLYEILYANECLKSKADFIFLPIWVNGFAGREILQEPRVSFLQTMESINASMVKGGDFESFLFPKLCEKLGSRHEVFENLYHRLVAPTVLQSRTDIEEVHSLQARLHPDVVSVDICALVANNLLNSHQRFFETASCPIRVVICDHTQPMLLDYANQVLHEGDEEDVAYWIENSLRSLKKLSSRNSCLQARTVNLPLTAAIFIIKCKNPMESSIKVDYYDFDCNDADRRSVMISRYDTDSFAFYEKQFEWIWDHARPI